MIIPNTHPEKRFRAGQVHQPDLRHHWLPEELRNCPIG
jgi:hypothetical protein